MVSMQYVMFSQAGRGYVVADSGGVLALRAPGVSFETVFERTELAGGRVILRAANGLYVQVPNTTGFGDLVLAAPTPAEATPFSEVWFGDDRVALETGDNLFVYVFPPSGKVFDNVLLADGRFADDASKLWLEVPPDELVDDFRARLAAATAPPAPASTGGGGSGGGGDDNDNDDDTETLPPPPPPKKHDPPIFVDS